MKTQRIQIRISASDKSTLQRRARAEGMGLSEYVLSRALPPAKSHFGEILKSLRNARDRRFALAQLNDFLTELDADEWKGAVASAPPPDLDPVTANRVAAMVEHAAVRGGRPVPDWTWDVPPLESPVFASNLKSLRAHLLRVSPVAFRRRNLFVDASIGDRV
jgi:uncharacterized protein (DUF1778 family)